LRAVSGMSSSATVHIGIVSIKEREREKSRIAERGGNEEVSKFVRVDIRCSGRRLHKEAWKGRNKAGNQTHHDLLPMQS
jgi:hypothetical protein